MQDKTNFRKDMKKERVKIWNADKEKLYSQKNIEGYKVKDSSPIKNNQLNSMYVIWILEEKSERQKKKINLKQ